MFANPLFAAAKLTLSYTGTVDNVNLYEDAGSPAVAQELYVYVTPTGIITGLETGDWPAGSLIRLFNQGYILGHGGAGGQGGPSAILEGRGTAGEAGQPAITLGCDFVLYMETGYLWGGGGGGGGGYLMQVGAVYEYGGGGGGGVSGGAGGPGAYLDPTLYAGTAATSGINATPGAGGDSPGCDGGQGGTWGQSGKPSADPLGIGGAAGGNGGPSILHNNYSWQLAYDNLFDLIANGHIKGVIK